MPWPAPEISLPNPKYSGHCRRHCLGTLYCAPHVACTPGVCVLSSRLASRLPPVVTSHSSPPTEYSVYRIQSRSAEMWRRRQSAGKRRSSSSTSGPLDRKEHLCPSGRGLGEPRLSIASTPFTFSLCGVGDWQWR